MEITGLRIVLKQLRDALVIAYSLLVMATIIPGFGHVSAVIVIPYYALVPGYFVATLFRGMNTVLEVLFYSIVWSLAVVTTVYSLETLGGGLQFIPISIVVPAFTILLLGYGRLHR